MPPLVAGFYESNCGERVGLRTLPRKTRAVAKSLATALANALSVGRNIGRYAVETLLEPTEVVTNVSR